MPNYSWYEEGSESPPPLSNQLPLYFRSAPVIQGSKVPPFQPINITYEFDQPYKQAESKMQVTGKISSNK